MNPFFVLDETGLMGSAGNNRSPAGETKRAIHNKHSKYALELIISRERGEQKGGKRTPPIETVTANNNLTATRGRALDMSGGQHAAAEKLSLTTRSISSVVAPTRTALPAASKTSLPICPTT